MRECWINVYGDKSGQWVGGRRMSGADAVWVSLLMAPDARTLYRIHVKLKGGT